MAEYIEKEQTKKDAVNLADSPTAKSLNCILETLRANGICCPDTDVLCAAISAASYEAWRSSMDSTKLELQRQNDGEAPHIYHRPKKVRL